jgi:hypothetical protein
LPHNGTIDQAAALTPDHLAARERARKKRFRPKPVKEVNFTTLTP